MTNSIGQMKREKKFFGFFVAEEEGEIISILLYFFAYFTWVGKSMYIGDLYVKPSHQGKNIGGRLLRRTIEVAKQGNCKRVRGLVLDWNEKAKGLYMKSGGHVSNKWLTATLEKKDIEVFLKNS